MMKKYYAILILLFSVTPKIQAQEDKLYCADNVYRNWWNVLHYDLNLNIPTDTNYISGTVTIKASVQEANAGKLQIDLLEPLSIQSISLNGIAQNSYHRENRSYLVDLNSRLQKGDTFELKISYSGIPVIAKKAPWDGGIVRKTDINQKPWIAVACQGAGASTWFPCKDIADDEPELGADLHYTTEKSLTAIGNGKLISHTAIGNDQQQWHWRVSQPINLYDITFYIGDYIHWSDTLQGEAGTLDLDYYVLRANEAKARKQFKVVKPMLHAFEYWMGAYPFYQDGYKLVDAPYLGMEHQSAVAYGNEYKMGYLGMDRSKTGVGLLFDFIIVHESGHEWYGNNISATDVAYSWIHEGFTTYTETLLAESLFGKSKAFRYQRGCWRLIRNDNPMEGKPGHCDGGSGDHYVKGSAMIHMIRMMLQDDNRFRELLRKMNLKYRHQTVSGKEIENFIQAETRLKLDRFFEQYLRKTEVPVLNIQKNASGFSYQWSNCIEGFDMPVLVFINKKPQWLYPSTAAQQFIIKGRSSIKISPDFYIRATIL